MQAECLKIVRDPRRGKNMFVLGMLCSIYSLEHGCRARTDRFIFGKKDGDHHCIEPEALLDAGFAWAEKNLDIKYKIPAHRPLNRRSSSTATRRSRLA